MIAACGQMEATTLDQAETVWPVVERLAAQAAERKADLFVLPETTYPAYWLESAERYMRDDIERSASVLERLGPLAAKHGFWLVVGFVEEEGGRLFNSAAVFDRGGRRVAIARKNFLWDCDNRWFSPGSRIAAFDSEFGRTGVLICADARSPEIAATLVSDGAQMLVLPTAWVNNSKVRRTYRNIHPDFLIRARAMESGVPFVCCSKSGREGEVMEYVGQSMIVSAQGRVLAQAPIGGEHLIVSELQAGTARPPEFDEATRRRLLSTQAPFRAQAPGGSCLLRLRSNAQQAATTIETAPGRVARMNVSQLGSFAHARCNAIDGAQVLVAQGRLSDDVMARARAAENRVFVIVAADSIQFVIDPDGTIAWRQADGGETLELDLGRADVKQFTPETDLWAQRRVDCYRFEAPVAAEAGS